MIGEILRNKMRAVFGDQVLDRTFEH